MKVNQFGCYLFGSRLLGFNKPESDVDLLLVCESKDRSNIEIQLRIQLAIQFPQWKGLALDIKHLPIGPVLPDQPVALLIAAELKARKTKPILGSDLLESTISIPRELLLKAELAILRYWARIFLLSDFESAFSEILSQRTLRGYYGCARAFVTYLVLYRNPHIDYIDQEKIPDPDFQKFRNLVQTKLNYSLLGLDQKTTAELLAELKLMHSFCKKIWMNIDRPQLRRVA